MHDRGSDSQLTVPVFCFWKMFSLTHKHFDSIPRSYTLHMHTLWLTHNNNRLWLLCLLVFCLSFSSLPSVPIPSQSGLLWCPITIITAGPPFLSFLPCSSYIITQLFVSFFRSKLCPPSFHKQLPIYPWAKSFSTNCSNWDANGLLGSLQVSVCLCVFVVVLLFQIVTELCHLYLLIQFLIHIL